MSSRILLSGSLSFFSKEDFKWMRSGLCVIYDENQSGVISLSDVLHEWLICRHDLFLTYYCHDNGHIAATSLWFLLTAKQWVNRVWRCTRCLWVVQEGASVCPPPHNKTIVTKTKQNENTLALTHLLRPVINSFILPKSPFALIDRHIYIYWPFNSGSANELTDRRIDGHTETRDRFYDLHRWRGW